MWEQGQMVQRINVALNPIPSGSRDLLEYIFLVQLILLLGVWD